MSDSTYRYPVLQRAQEITRDPDLDILEMRKHLGVPLAIDIKNWLADQPPLRLLNLDFSGIRAVTLSVAEEVGPLLSQEVGQRNSLDQRYPIFRLSGPEPAYTFARAFANHGLAALGIVKGPVEPTTSMVTISQNEEGCDSVVVLGQLSKQMEQILKLADAKSKDSERLTSEDLVELDFLASVSPAARSKRLTELYSRRLLAYEENPANPRERLFTAAWRLPTR